MGIGTALLGRRVGCWGTVLPLCGSKELKWVRGNSQMRTELFRILSGDREYRIYTNGEVVGFGDDAVVINNFPFLMVDAELRAKRAILGAGGDRDAV